ncbi:MAG: hypothetical protein F6J97_00230 [Leptolyngbya sp. SIO4C1]|nr:hypothetical protein [Leptolyngbya sp. SIO4C1]
MSEPETPANNEDLLKSLDADFQQLQQHFAAQLAQDIHYLEAEKARLLSAIEQLRQRYEALEAHYQELQQRSDRAFSQQQAAQQQTWAKQLARVMAKNLQEDLRSYVVRSAEQGLMVPSQANELLSSLDATLSQTLQSLQQDLSSYQSAMAQQLTRMQAMEQRGEAILENLVTQLSQQLRDSQLKIHQARINNAPLVETSDTAGSILMERSRANEPQLPMAPSRRLEPPYGGQTLSGPRIAVRMSEERPQRQKGLAFSAIATLLWVLSLLLVAAIAQGSSRFGLRFEPLVSFSIWTAIALVWLRMLVLVPAVCLLAPQLHRGVWSELQQIRQSPQLALQLAGSGFFLICSEIFLYQAAALLGPTLAAALLFAYPIVSIPLIWSVSRERPSLLRWVVMGAIAMGLVLIARPGFTGASPTGLGAALLAALAFALYLVTLNLHPARQSHAATISVVHAAVAAVLTSVLLLIRPVGLIAGMAAQFFLLGGLGLGCVASLRYLCQQLGLRLAGGHRAAVVMAAAPLLTAGLAWLLLSQPSIQLIQGAGVVLIAIAGIALSLDRLGKRA